MIKFFRRFRQQLLIQNKFSKYILYAIGEIILVVFGILIALQINNWNDTKKNALVEQNFFKEILDDIEKDRTEIDNIIDFYDNRIEQLGWLLKAIRHPNKKTEILEFGKHVEPLYYNIPPISYSSAYESAKSSGVFEKIKNKNLLKELTQYYTEYSEIEALLTSTLRIIETQLEPIMATIPENYLQTSSSTNVIAINQNDNNLFYSYISEIGDSRDIKIDLKSFLQKPEFENFIIGDMGRAFNCKATINLRLKFLSSIENDIKTYLND